MLGWGSVEPALLYLAEHKLCVSVEFTTMEGIKALGCAFLAMLISVGS